MRWKSIFKPVIWVGKKIILPTLARSLWAKHKPRDPILAAALEYALEEALDEVLGLDIELRPDLISSHMANRLQSRFPNIPRGQLLAFSDAYAKGDVRIKRRLKNI